MDICMDCAVEDSVDDKRDAVQLVCVRVCSHCQSRSPLPISRLAGSTQLSKTSGTCRSELLSIWSSTSMRQSWRCECQSRKTSTLAFSRSYIRRSTRLRPSSKTRPNSTQLALVKCSSCGWFLGSYCNCSRMQTYFGVGKTRVSSLVTINGLGKPATTGYGTTTTESSINTCAWPLTNHNTKSNPIA